MATSTPTHSIESILHEAIDHLTMRRVLHALTNVCYARAEIAERLARTLKPGSAAQLQMHQQAEAWNALGRRVSRTTELAKEALL